MSIYCFKNCFSTYNFVFAAIPSWVSFFVCTLGSFSLISLKCWKNRALYWNKFVSFQVKMPRMSFLMRDMSYGAQLLMILQVLLLLMLTMDEFQIYQGSIVGRYLPVVYISEKFALVFDCMYCRYKCIKN
jgi:hypothetical protein